VNQHVLSHHELSGTGTEAHSNLTEIQNGGVFVNLNNCVSYHRRNLGANRGGSRIGTVELQHPLLPLDIIDNV
jgi:hypothetical protein